MPEDDNINREAPDLVVDGDVLEIMVEDEVYHTEQRRVNGELYEFRIEVNGKVV